MLVCSSEKFHFDSCQSFFIFFSKVQISLPYKSLGRAKSVLYTFILEFLWTKVGLNVLFRISSIRENFASCVECSSQKDAKIQLKELRLSRNFLLLTDNFSLKGYGLCFYMILSYVFRAPDI